MGGAPVPAGPSTDIAGHDKNGRRQSKIAHHRVSLRITGAGTVVKGNQDGPPISLLFSTIMGRQFPGCKGPIIPPNQVIHLPGKTVDRNPATGVTGSLRCGTDLVVEKNRYTSENIRSHLIYSLRSPDRPVMFDQSPGPRSDAQPFHGPFDPSAHATNHP